MNYCTYFYWFCPRTKKEEYIEVHIFKDEKPADQLEYWGSLISLPATNEVQILSVFRNGNLWEDYPNTLEEEIYSQPWECISKRA